MIKYLYILFLLGVNIAVAQKPNAQDVETSVDRKKILMGEEVKYTVSVGVTTRDLVTFPELKNIGAMEVINSYPIDSIRKNDKLRIFKQYGITHFDSGDYKLPRIEIIKNTKKIYSDSLLVQVREVKVDTTKQKMFPIKGAIKIDEQSPFNWWWLLLLLVIPVGILVYLLSRKRIEKSYEETLQPFEWTKFRLSKLDESNYVENRQWKEYYSELTYIIRKYIDTKVYDHALESTTSQLIDALKVAMLEKGMSITPTTQSRLENILQRADLVKFANAAGDGITAKEDRIHMNDILYNINQVLPQPTEEELMLDAKYRAKIAMRRRFKLIAGIVGLSIVAFIISVVVWILISGKENVKDAILGNELRELYEQPKLKSTYGLPEIEMVTPEILVRQKGSPFPPEIEALTKEVEYFTLDESIEALQIEVGTVIFSKKVPEDFTIKNFIDPIIVALEKRGAKNIITLDEQIKLDGRDAIQLSGTYDKDGEQYDYVMYLLSESGGLQTILIANQKDDTENTERRYGSKLLEEIKKSIKIIAPVKKDDNQNQEQQ